MNFGVGNRDLLILPGLSTVGIAGKGESLAGRYSALGKDHRVTVLDMPQPIPEDFTFETAARTAALAMESLGIARADVLGISMGGMIAQYLALCRPEMVRSMVLVSTVSGPDRILKENLDRWIRTAPNARRRELEKTMFALMHTQSHTERFSGLLFPENSPAGDYEKEFDRKRFVALCRLCLSCSVYERLSGIAVPALVIGGAGDRVMDPESFRLTAEGLGCELFIYPELGHALYDEAADFLQRVLSFFEGIDERSINGEHHRDKRP